MGARQDQPSETTPWDLACITFGADGQHDIRALRTLSFEESVATYRANELLWSITSNEPPYSRLESRLDQFEGAMRDAIRAMEEGVPQRPNPPITHVFGEALSAFGLFLNQMPHWLKTQFGPDTSSIAAFRKACSREYERVFEYRLAYNLQNETRHRTDVLHVTFGKALGTPARVDAVISNEVLDHALNDKKWQSAVRKELVTHQRPIRAEDLLLALRGCTHRIYASTLLAERVTLDKAIRVVQGLADGLECAGQLALVAIRNLPPEPGRLTPVSFSIQNLELEAARVLQKALQDGERIVWPRFAIQVSPEWLEKSASEALLQALADDPTVDASVIAPVEQAGVFVGITAETEYAAESAVARAIVRSGVAIDDHRSGPTIRLP